MSDLINIVAAATGIPVAMVPTVAIVVGGNILGKVIPDDKKGFWGVLRKVAKVAGVVVSNRVQPGISVDKVATKAADDVFPGYMK